jgi:hypothetical protein
VPPLPFPVVLPSSELFFPTARRFPAVARAGLLPTTLVDLARSLVQLLSPTVAAFVAASSSLGVFVNEMRNGGTLRVGTAAATYQILHSRVKIDGIHVEAVDCCESSVPTSILAVDFTSVSIFSSSSSSSSTSSSTLLLKSSRPSEPPRFSSSKRRSFCKRKCDSSYRSRMQVSNTPAILSYDRIPSLNENRRHPQLMLMAVRPRVATVQRTAMPL